MDYALTCNLLLAQHWVNAITRYYLDWIVELRKVFPGIEFFGQDDKAKMPVGDTVPIATGVRPGNRKGMAPVDGNNPMAAMDHDFHSVNIITSVALHCNIPDEVSGTFFVGHDETGFRQIFVTLRDATFDGSNVFDHCAKLVDIIKKNGWKPTVLVLHTDGGPDHSLKRIAVKFALIAMFKELDLDHLVILRCASNGSACNKVERSMSVLNIGVAHVSLKQGEMLQWAEKMASKCGSMKEVRNEAKKVDDARVRAMTEVQEIEEKLSLARANNGEHNAYFCFYLSKV